MPIGLPKRGDIITFNIAQGAGSRKINGPHDCIVISHFAMHLRLNMGIVIPTSSSRTAAIKLGKLAIALPSLPNMHKHGWAHVHQIQSIDFDDITFRIKSSIDLSDEHLHAFFDGLIDRFLISLRIDASLACLLAAKLSSLMAYINENYLKLKAGYLFPEIGRRVKEFAAANPQAKVIRMGIGDVTEPLPPACIAAMHKAVDEMANRDTFKGYGPEQGYDFLREAIAKNDFQSRGCDITADEIFVSDGSKCDCANVLDILGPRNIIAVTDPVYPVYVDTNVMAGHTGDADDVGEYAGLIYLRAEAARGFAPQLPETHVDVIYLCSPNNPTGATLTRPQLTEWVRFAKENDALILYDAAYEAFITDPTIPHSIYEIQGAKEVAIEFRSFSKTAGFTGTRCACTVVPRALMGKTSGGERVDLYRLWNRRHTTKFNGVSYIVQRGAEAVYSTDGKRQTRALIEHYLANAGLIRQALTTAGLTVFGGTNAPYCWVQTPGGAKSWDFFDRLLNKAHVVCTPGAGFGSAGEGYIRFSAFNSRANVEEAMGRVTAAL